jgi:5-hydroxyisourate hydrolase-like protein (transthyretin family)
MKKLLLLLIFSTSVFMVFACDNKTSKDPIISGTVIDAATKKPVSDVAVTVTLVYNFTKTEITVSSDANGQYKIMQAPTGNYKIKFEKDNYKTTEKNNIAVKPETLTKVNVELDFIKEEETEDYRRIFLKYNY